MSVANTIASPLGILSDVARPLTGATTDYDPVLELIGDAKLALLGEASHGTHEFYAARAAITKRLIEECGFNAVAAEADWPDAYRANRYAQGQGTDLSADEALSDFRRFPSWMWRNEDVEEFLVWLRVHNGNRLPWDRAGFYGLDMYSLHASMAAVLAYLDDVDPEAARRARFRYGCFESFGSDPQNYGMAAGLGLKRDCEDEVVQQLQEIQLNGARYLSRAGMLAEDEQFFAERNAQVVADAERYYRSMFWSEISTWNLRDSHMAETLESLIEHIEKHGRRARIVVWEHNSHLGDARATDQGQRGEINVGQLVRERHGSDAVLIGFSTYTGTVTAASDWGSVAEHKRVRPALSGSYETLFHETGLGDFFLDLRGSARIREILSAPMLQRAIGVIYRPETERQSHYYHARLAEQFDGMIHMDRTRAVFPLERGPAWRPQEDEEYPEGYPTGL